MIQPDDSCDIFIYASNKDNPFHINFGMLRFSHSLFYEKISVIYTKKWAFLLNLTRQEQLKIFLQICH